VRLPTYFRATLVSLSILAGGCSGAYGPGSIPSNLSLGGTWAGTINDSVAGAGNIRVLMSQDTGYSGLYGTWMSDVSLPLTPTPLDPNSNRRGGVQGSVNSYAANFTLSPGDGPPSTACLLQVGAAVNLRQNQMVGSYTYVSDGNAVVPGCSVIATGGITLNRQ